MPHDTFLFHCSDIVLFLPMQISYIDWLLQYFTQIHYISKKKKKALLYCTNGGEKAPNQTFWPLNTKAAML